MSTGVRVNSSAVQQSNNNNNGVSGAAAGSHFEISAPSRDTLGGGRKEKQNINVVGQRKIPKDQQIEDLIPSPPPKTYIRCELSPPGGEELGDAKKVLVQIELRHNHFSTFFHFHKNNTKLLNMCFNIFFPQKGTLTDAGDGEGGANKYKQSLKKRVCFICFPLEGNFD